MRTLMIVLVPCVLLAGLLFGVFKLEHIPSQPSCPGGDCPTALSE